MNYEHAYHAGNFSDVIKHVLLSTLVQFFTKKETAFCYIDTHAGAGIYDLEAVQAKKTEEYILGIEKIIQQPDPPPLVKRYLDCVHAINNHLLKTHYASLRYYPGSPMLVKQLLRPHDRIIACELQTKTYQALKSNFAGDKQVAVHHSDGFLGLKAFLPPQEKRGLILIDPPYENPNEYDRILKTLPAALKRFPTGTYAIWYPIKAKSQSDHFLNTARRTLPGTLLSIELTIYPDLSQHLNGSGLLVINPPWQFDDAMKPLLPWLWNALTINGQGHHIQQILKSLLQ